jgi:hypothetical protein
VAILRTGFIAFGGPLMTPTWSREVRTRCIVTKSRFSFFVIAITQRDVSLPARTHTRSRTCTCTLTGTLYFESVTVNDMYGSMSFYVRHMIAITPCSDASMPTAATTLVSVAGYVVQRHVTRPFRVAPERVHKSHCSSLFLQCNPAGTVSSVAALL